MRLLSKKDVRERVGFSFAHIDRMEKEPEYAHLRFPRRVQIGFRVFWPDEEIEDFIRKQIALRDAIASS